MAGLVSIDTGCASFVPSQDDTVSVYSFSCGDGLEYVVSVEGRVAWIFLPGITVDLLLLSNSKEIQVFGKGRNRLEIQGNQATLFMDGKSYVGCQNDRRRAIWEKAKLSGVDFRGVGNEPPWILEITGDRIVFLMGYDKKAMVFQGDLQTNLVAATTFYRGSNDNGHQLYLRLQPAKCRDSMSGDLFETRVEFTLDGKTYTGCGAALH